MSNFNKHYPSSPPRTSSDISTDISEKKFAQQQNLPPHLVLARQQADAAKIASYPQTPQLFVCTTTIASVLPHEEYERAYAFVSARWKHVPKSRTMKSTVDILQYIMELLLEYTHTTPLGVFPRSAPRLCHKFWAAMRDMSVLRKVPVGHLHARFESSRDDDCRILGVVMCVGANESRVDDLHLGLGLRPYPDVPVSSAVVAQYLRKEQDRWSLDNTMVADVLSIPSPGEQIRRTARYGAVEMAYRMLRLGPRGGQISGGAARNMKAQWLGQIGHEPQGPTMGEGRLMWASASGQPTTDGAVFFSIKAEELLEAMECIAWLRDTSHIPFPK